MQQNELIGTTLGNYRIISTLGQGGMASVYRAYQENLDREVAIKILPPWFAADQSFVARFKSEARLVARLAHPNIVTVHDASEQNGHLYIVMQLVDGGTLKHYLEKVRKEGKPVPLNEVSSIFTQVASALAYAHDQGIVHRDVKPVNVLMDRAGRPILSDFGIAKALAGSQEQLTRAGAGVGTPEYMSPEQCQGVAVDARADIYALGIMLFEVLTGRTPFKGNNYPALAHAHIYEPVPRPTSFNPAIPPAIEQIIMKALMKAPQQRFQSASEMSEALKQALTMPPVAQGYFHGAQAQNAPAYMGGRSQIPSAPSQESLVMYACFNCRRPNKGSTRYCVSCGFTLNQCPHCGFANTASNRFCTKCGQAITR